MLGETFTTLYHSSGPAAAAFGNETYLMLTRDFGWSQQQYETWVTDAVRRLLAT